MEMRSISHPRVAGQPEKFTLPNPVTSVYTDRTQVPVETRPSLVMTDDHVIAEGTARITSSKRHLAVANSPNRLSYASSNIDSSRMGSRHPL